MNINDEGSKSDMNKVLPLIVFSLLSFSFPIILGEPVLEFKLSPDPIFDQVWAHETYLVNVTLHIYNMSNFDLTGYNGSTDKMLIEHTITWTGKGGYDFGNSTTGYSYDPIKYYLNQSSPLGTKSFLFNLTFEKDSFDFGIKPYETVEVQVESNVYLIMNDDSKGSAIISRKIDLYLIDEMKSQYLSGKYEEMQEEIFTVTDRPGLDLLNRDKYLKYLNNFNASLTEGNYIKALELWKNYDENDRLDLIKECAKVIEIASEKLNELESVENKLESLKDELETLQSEYELLDETYIALSNTYQKVNTELNSAKKNLSTSISAVFLAALIFYFIGQHGIGRLKE